MFTRFMLATSVVTTLAAPAAAEQRCGWIVNSAPANWWLLDSQGTWIIGAQGGFQATWFAEQPDFSAGEWIDKGPSHGYGCTCLKVRSVQGEERYILTVDAVEQLPLSRCEADSALPPPWQD